MTKIVLFALALIFVAFLFTRGGTHKSDIVIGANTTILAFGDSLTEGFGASENESYPAQLSKLLGLRVINGGKSGEVSKDGLLRLPSLLSEYRPQIVILCHGGNDILRKHNLSVTKNNIAQMIQLAQNAGAEVVLVGVPSMNGLLIDTASFYGELAREYHLIYEDDIMDKIIKSPALKSDQIHPNKDGYLLLARELEKLLRSHFNI